MASRDLPEVSELDLECSGTPTNTGALAVLPDLADDLAESITRGFVGEEIGGKRALGTDRFPYSIGADGPLVDAPRSPVIIGARFTKMLMKKGQGAGPEVEPGFDPEPLHLLGCRRSDAVKLPDRQGFDEYRSHSGSDYEEPVRLAVIRGKLGEELVVGDAGRGRELGFGADPCPDFFRDLCRRDDALEVFGDIKIRLVERQWLDDRRVFGEDLPDLERDRLVDVEPRLYENQIRAFSLSRERRHRGAHAELARFVARGRDDAAFPRSADRDRLPTQRRIVALFDRCVERIHVDMDDLARSCRRLGRRPLRALFGRHFNPCRSPSGESTTVRHEASSYATCFACARQHLR